MVTIAQYRRHVLAQKILAAIRQLDVAGIVAQLGTSPDATAARTAIETLRTLGRKYVAD